MNYLEQINFNNSIIELYKNSEWDYKQKIYILIRENIEFYHQLNALKRVKRLKPIQTTQNKEKTHIWLNSKFSWLYSLPYHKINDITEQDIENEIELWFNLHKNNEYERNI